MQHISLQVLEYTSLGAWSLKGKLEMELNKHAIAAVDLHLLCPSMGNLNTIVKEIQEGQTA